MLFGLASCENFLDNGDIKKEIDEYIEIANSSPITYFVTAEEGSGTATPDQVKVKKKETFDLRFKPSGDWKFIRWEAINKSTGEIVENAIKFENPDQTETKAQVINPGEGLLIHAKCVQIPTIIDYEPQKSANANQPIIVKFNMPVEAAETDSSASLFNFQKNISLTCNDDDLSYCFETPVFNSDKTELTIVPKTTTEDGVLLKKYMTDPEKNLSLATIQLTFSSELLIQSGDLQLPVDNPTIYVNYLPTVETTPPQKKALVVTRNAGISIENGESFADEIFHTEYIINKKEDVSVDTYEDLVLQNACNGTFYIYGRYFDEGSGIKNVVVEETFLRSQLGESYSPKVLTFSYDQSSENTTFQTINGDTYFLIKHTLSGEDGIYNITVSVRDECNNKSDTTYNIIRKTNMGCVSLYKNGSDYKKLQVSFIGLNEIDGPRTVYNGVFYPVNTVTFTLNYLKTDNQYGEVTKTSPDQIYGNPIPEECFYDFTVDDINVIPGSSIKLICTDFIGNNFELTIDFPETNKKILLDIQKKSTYADITCLDENGHEIYDAFLLRKANSNGTETKLYRGQRKIEPGYTYRIGINTVILDDYLLKFEDLSDSLAPVQIEDVKIQKSKNEGYFTVTVCLAEDTWVNNSAVYLSYGYFASEKISVPSGVTTISFEQYNFRLYSDFTIRAYAICNNQRTPESSWPITAVSPADPDYDNSAPYIDSIVPHGDYFDFKIKDDGTGIKKANIRVVNKKINLDKNYSLNGSNSYTCSIPVWYLLPSTTNASLLYLDFEDNANNKKSTETDIFDAHGIENLVDQRFYRNTDGNLCIEFDHHGFLKDYCFTFKTSLNQNRNGKIGFESIFDSDGSLEGSDLELDCIYSHKNTAEYYRVIISKDEMPVNSFVKVVKFLPTSYLNDGYYLPPVYFYNNTPGSGENDFIIPNGSSKESLVINSDAPVFVHTVVTSIPYDECKEWEASEWLYYKEEFGHKILDFSPTSSPKVYNIPVSEIEKGKCYVVIAHYSDNHVLVSDVMVK